MLKLRCVTAVMGKCSCNCPVQLLFSATAVFGLMLVSGALDARCKAVGRYFASVLLRLSAHDPGLGLLGRRVFWNVTLVAGHG